MIDFIRYSNQESFENYNIFNEEVDASSNTGAAAHTAVVFYDKEGNIIRENGDYLLLRYVEENVILGGGEADAQSKIGWIDLTKTEIPWLKEENEDAVGWYHFITLKIQGVVNGTEIIPTKMEYVPELIFDEIVFYGFDAHAGENIDEYERDDRVIWETVYEQPEKDIQGELVTIYATVSNLTYYKEGPSISLEDGKEYDSLMDMLKSKKADLDDGYGDDNYQSLDYMIMFYKEAFYPLTDYELDKMVYEEWPEPEMEVMTAIMTRPWLVAINQMKSIYLAVFVIFFCVWVILFTTIKNQLVKPLQEVNRCMKDGYLNLTRTKNREVLWKEITELQENYKEVKEELSIKRNEITRLKTALSYAEKAEKNRRQMTSNIAHELKTPLAIIHSYTEGLKEHIAEDKKEE